MTSDDRVEQALLTAFDVERTVDDPYLSPKNAMEALAEHWGIDIEEAVMARRMDELVAAKKLFKKDLGKDGIFRPLLAPALAPAHAEISDERQETPPEEFVALEDGPEGVDLHPEVATWVSEQDEETQELVADELAAAADDPEVALKPFPDRQTEKLKLGLSEYRAELVWDRATGDLRVLQIATRNSFYAAP